MEFSNQSTGAGGGGGEASSFPYLFYLESDSLDIIGADSSTVPRYI